MAVNGLTSDLYGSYYTYNYGYNNTSSGISSESWGQKATEEADALKESLGISDTNKTSSSSTTSNTTASSTSAFLMGYQTRLEDLEASASKLQLGTKNNVFSKYDEAADKVSKGEGTEDTMTKAIDDVYSAVKDLVDSYNNTINYLKNNGTHGNGLSSQMESLKRAIPTEQGLKYLGMSFDTKGNLQIDEEKFKETMQKDPDFVKNSFGGQFGIADRLGAKASAILDSSVDQVLNSGAISGSTGSDDTSKTTSQTVATYGASSTKETNMSDSFKQFAAFSKSGAYNLSNYFAVSMLNILA